MTRTVLKKKIHNCVDHINDDKVLEAVYTLLNGHVNDDYELSEDDLKIINVRRKAILRGEEKTYTVAEVKKKLMKNIGK